MVDGKVVAKMFNMVSAMFYYIENNYKIPGDVMFETLCEEHYELQELMKPVEITVSMLSELSEYTGYGMVECKRVLRHCRGDMERAKEYLR